MAAGPVVFPGIEVWDHAAWVILPASRLQICERGKTLQFTQTKFPGHRML
jgi:hypothetical protein